MARIFIKLPPETKVPIERARAEALCVTLRLIGDLTEAWRVLREPTSTPADVARVTELAWRLYAARQRTEPDTYRLRGLLVAIDLTARCPNLLGHSVAETFRMCSDIMEMYGVPDVSDEEIGPVIEAWNDREGGRRGKPSKWRLVADLARRFGMSPPSEKSIKALWHSSVRPTVERVLSEPTEAEREHPTLPPLPPPPSR